MKIVERYGNGTGAKGDRASMDRGGLVKFYSDLTNGIEHSHDDDDHNYNQNDSGPVTMK